MSVLTELRDHLKSCIDAAQADAALLMNHASEHRDVLAKVEAEIAAAAKAPNFDDLRALIDRMAAGNAHTG